MSTGYLDNSFDDIICNRLFHHFYDANTRKKALKELSRISCGYIVIFFNSFSLSAKFRQFKRFIKKNHSTDRIAIPMSLFIEEIESQGLTVVKTIPVNKHISAM